MNVQGLLISVLLWVASVAGAYFYGHDTGKASEIAHRAEVKQAIEETRKIAMEGAAHEIAGIRVRNTTIQGRVETVVRDNPVYRDCSHDAIGLQLVNQALAGSGPGSKPLGDGKLSGTDAAH